MQLRYEVGSLFCRKALMAVRLRRFRVELHEVCEAVGSRDAFGAMPLLLTEHGARTAPGEIVALLERRVRSARTLLPEASRPAIEALDRLLDLYLLEPAITMATEPGTQAAVSAVYTAMRTLDLIEDRLRTGQRQLVGDALTLVDLTAVIGIAEVERHGVALPPRVSHWLARMRLHGAVRDTLDEAEALAELRRAGVHARRQAA